MGSTSNEIWMGDGGEDGHEDEDQYVETGKECRIMVQRSRLWRAK